MFSRRKIMHKIRVNTGEQNMVAITFQNI